MADPVNRLLAIGLPEGAGQALVRTFDGVEQLGQGFRFRVELLAERALNAAALIGENVTVRVMLADGGNRCFNGHVARLVQLRNEGRHFRYEATLVPWTWFLTRQADCRLFHPNAELDLLKKNKVPDIVTEIWKEAGFSSDSFGSDKLNLRYPERDLTVQYRETTYNFCQRLMEQEGIYYYFEHEDGKHKLVMCDNPANHDPCVREELPLRSGGDAPTTDEEVTDWVVEREIQPMNAALADFDFTKPNTPLRQVGTDTLEVENRYEMFDYPGEFTETEDGDRLARIRAEELAGQFMIIRGRSTVRTIEAGRTFKLTGSLRPDQRGSFLVVSVTHRAVCDLTESGSRSSGTGSYECSFVARPADRQFRPARTSPRPTVAGPQTAIVVGASGDEIHVDPDGYGMVKLHFHWDRYDLGNENSSPWIRVSQNWAGRKWGAMFLPRVGQEVIVEFLEGDPDKPIITGRVHNNENMPPYELPANKTMSSIKSNSVGAEGFNELRFEDKGGEEQVFLHAQKNLDVRVLNDAFEYIGNDKHLQVEVDNHAWIKNDNSVQIDRDHKEEIGRDRNLKVVGKEAKEVTKSVSLKVGEDVIEEFGKNHSEVVTKDYYLKADNIVIEAATNITIKVGDQYIAIDSKGVKIGSAGKIAYEATGEVSMKSTGGDVKIESGAGELSLKGTTGLKADGTVKADVKAAKVAVEGQAMVEVKGGMVKIG